MRVYRLTGFCALAMLSAGVMAQAVTQAPASTNAEATAEIPSITSGVRSHTTRQPAHLSPQQVLDGNVHRLSKALNLDIEQQGRLRTILQSEREQMLSLRRDSGGNATDRVGALHAILDHTREQIRAMLNDDQKKIYQTPVPQDLTAPAQADTGHWLDLMQRPKAQSAKDAN